MLRGTPDKVEFFGEKSLMQGKPYPTTVKVLSETAKTLSMDKDSLEIILERYVTERNDDSPIRPRGDSMPT